MGSYEQLYAPLAFFKADSNYHSTAVYKLVSTETSTNKYASLCHAFLHSRPLCSYRWSFIRSNGPTAAECLSQIHQQLIIISLWFKPALSRWQRITLTT